MHLYYLPISALIFITSFRLFQIASGSMSLRRLNLVSWVFYFGLILQSFIGINLAFVFGVEHYLISRTAQEHLILSYWSIAYTLIALPIAMIFTQKFIWGGKIKAKLFAYFAAPIRPLQSRKDSALLAFWGGMSLIALAATLYVYSVVGQAPFIALFSSNISSFEFAQLRIDAGREFGGNQYIRNLFSILLAPFVSYVAFAYSLLYPHNRRIKLWFFMTFATAVLAVTSDGQKLPILNYLLALFFIRGFIRGGFTPSRIVSIAILTAILISFLYILTTGHLDIGLTRGPIGRIVMTAVAGVPLHFMVFPSMHPFLQGASFPGWLAGSLFGVEHARSARVLMEIINPAAVESGTAGVINTLFIAEAWANFGWIGLIVAPFIVGFVIQTIYNALLSLPKTPVFVAAMGFFMVNTVITGGFVDFIWNVAWLMLFLWIVLSILSRQFLVLPWQRRERPPQTGASAADDIHSSLSTVPNQ
ncbi:MAG: hypothetical protein NZL98_04160 [Anaerolineales bacterium]|nr:hypothetical protein [Anaerolineales bacterium]